MPHVHPPPAAVTEVPKATRPASLPEEELHRLHRDDWHAAAAVAGLMAAIFTMGLIGYTVICFLAAR